MTTEARPAHDHSEPHHPPRHPERAPVAMSPIAAKDLTREVPRSPYAELGGYPWLPRLIDKVRALGAGTIGDYTPFPCGGDQIFLAAMGVEAAALKAEIDRGTPDAAIVTWLQANAAPGHETTIADVVAQLHAPIEGGEPLEWLNAAKEALTKARPALDVSGVTNFIHLICVEEGHPVPAKPQVEEPRGALHS